MVEVNDALLVEWFFYREGKLFGVGIKDFFVAIDYILERQKVFKARKVEEKAQSFILEALNDPQVTLKSFEDISLHASIFDDKQDELRHVLVHLGAKRYPMLDGQEMWGLYTRNSNKKAVAPFEKRPVVNGIIAGISAAMIVVCTLFAAAILTIEAIRLFIPPKINYGVQLASALNRNCKQLNDDAARLAEYGIFDGDYVIYENPENGAIALIAGSPSFEDAREMQKTAREKASDVSAGDLSNAIAIDLKQRGLKPYHCE